MENNCIFCEIPNDEKLIQDGKLCYARWDGFPVNPGHALIIPKRHVESYFDLTSEEITEMLSIAKIVKHIVEVRYNPDGYNVGFNVGECGGQSIMHVHMHIIPRYKGDVENPRGGVRGVIPTKQNY